MGTFTLETAIASPVPACFELSLSVEAHTASMGATGEEAVAGVRAGVLGPGDSVTWQARHLGVRFRMTSTISDYERPHRFVDEQVSGPFATWWHEHTFTGVDGGTVMVDVVRLPFAAVGEWADRLAVRRYLTELVRRRNTWLKRELEAAATGPAHGRPSAAVQAQTWVVWRQDDNGHRAEVSRHARRADAESHAAALEARGHKQLYWVSPARR